MTTETKTLAQILAEKSRRRQGVGRPKRSLLPRSAGRRGGWYSVLVYINEEFGHPEMGQAKYVSYGSEHALDRAHPVP